jgi:hypothetical protein
MQTGRFAPWPVQTYQRHRNEPPTGMQENSPGESSEIWLDFAPAVQYTAEMPDLKVSGSYGTTALERRIEQVARTLRNSLGVVLDNLPGAPHRPQELARALKLNKTLSSRLAKAARTPDALASAHSMPGPHGLRMFLKAAAKQGVSRDAIVAAEEAVSSFDQLIRRDIGDRAAFDAMVSDSFPHARKKFETYHKQAMFKAVANLKGVTVDVYLRTYLLHPGHDPLHHDYAMILGLLGLRRLRPRAVVQVSNVHLAPDADADTRYTLDGELAEGVDGLLLEPYCSVPRSRLLVRHVGSSMHYVLGGDQMGRNSAVDIVIGELDRAFFKRRQFPERHRKSAATAEIEQPAQTLVFDMLLHKDVWPGCEPELLMYDMVVRGPADPNDPARAIDRLDLDESIQYLGEDATRFRVPEVPRYVDMLKHVCDRLNWNCREFRGYRCRIHYPFYGSQLCMAFDPPS